jgi:ABC-type glycerol-3-phosphate transport system substrate-binding protein
MRYGVDIYNRFTNGEATEEDWRKALQFHEQLMQYANEDYVSTRGMFENQRRVAAGDGALTYQGNWGRTAFLEANMQRDEDYGRTQFPGPDRIFEYNPSSYIVFSNSGKEKAATLIAIANMFPEYQKLINEGKGTPPARTDLELDTERFPNIVTYGVKYAAEAKLIPKYNVGFPPEVISSMSPEIVSYLEGGQSLDQTVSNLMEIQNQHSDQYVFSF